MKSRNNELKLNILINSGEGYLFSLQEREIIFSAMEEYASQSSPCNVQGYSESDMYQCALQFFYHWWNQPGNNTAQTPSTP